MTPASAFRRLAPAVAVFAAVGLAAPAAQASESPDVEKALAAVKAANDKYMDPKVAVADGFAATDQCVESPTGDGVMGYHYVNEKLMGAMDQDKPPILVYQPDGKGGRTLVAVEYFKPDADQNLATSDDKPSLFGRGFDGPMEGHSPEMPKHYDLHAWLWQTNPAGVFTMYNKAGSCKVTTASTGSTISTDSTDSTGSTGSTDGQVSSVPAGGAHAGDGSPASADHAWLFAVGAAGMAAGGLLIANGARTARRKD